MHLPFPITLLGASLIIGWSNDVAAFCSEQIGSSCDITTDHPCCTDDAHIVFCDGGKWAGYVCQVQCFSIDATHTACDI